MFVTNREPSNETVAPKKLQTVPTTLGVEVSKRISVLVLLAMAKTGVACATGMTAANVMAARTVSRANGFFTEASLGRAVFFEIRCGDGEPPSRRLRITGTGTVPHIRIKWAAKEQAWTNAKTIRSKPQVVCAMPYSCTKKRSCGRRVLSGTQVAACLWCRPCLAWRLPY